MVTMGGKNTYTCVILLWNESGQVKRSLHGIHIEIEQKVSNLYDSSCG